MASSPCGKERLAVTRPGLRCLRDAEHQLIRRPRGAESENNFTESGRTMSYLERIFSRPAKLPSLADNVVQLARLTQDEVAGNRRVAMALAKDQVMSAKLLRLANAASYGSRGKVESLEQALT